MQVYLHIKLMVMRKGWFPLKAMIWDEYDHKVAMKTLS